MFGDMWLLLMLYCTVSIGIFAIVLSISRFTLIMQAFAFVE